MDQRGIEISTHPGGLLVEFPDYAGLEDVATRGEDLAEKSALALDAAMDSIRQLASRVESTVSGLIHRPQDVEIEFGLKLDVEAGALIARTSAEAHINVTLKWHDREAIPGVAGG